MNIADIVNRAVPAEPWVDGEKIPWDEPGFSARMLKEHLSQDHDAASRKLEIVRAQVDYVVDLLGHGRDASVLDLACGPGLHSHELARRGHRATGIDFSPASIEWAKSIAASERLTCNFSHADIRHADYGTRFDLALLLFGEINVFKVLDLKTIVGMARQALSHGGVLLLEPHNPGVVRANFETSPKWSAFQSGLFSDRPHVLLEEGFWHEDVQTAVKRWYVIDSNIGSVTLHSQSVVEYTRDRLARLVEDQGFKVSVAAPDWPGGHDFYPLVAIAR